ncbi:protein disulfide-isomerase A6 [Angomonas deanei]|uniref:Protein disulfide-isomerase n=1 Tax=Angomonas deanei TaxID=59799 RepID=A0A7G2CFK3_9TRYP|nr:protein disulfide-isomerase A6 [Angomonas deanei]CAD2218125.1 Thioredoxin/Thioredoxin-like domain/Thioredoxin-like, putative [Angomonas deanei]|eukprot:EPY37757.1 protein disulfide-isomerase A6 [Angomonas deanei]
MAKLTAALLASLLLAAGCQGKVASLNEADFETGIKKTEYTLVKFFAPWCGHCKKLAPEFEKASDALGDKATLAEVDCTQNEKLCGKFDVKGYPTLILFKNGEKHLDFDGGRTAPEIISYVKSQYEPAVSVSKTQADVDKLVKEGLPVVVIKTASETSQTFKTLEPIAKTRRLSNAFTLVSDAAVVKASPMESITFLANGESAVLEIKDGVSEKDINKFLDLNSVPLFGTITPENFKNYMAAGEHGYAIGFLFTKDEKESPETKAAAAVAKQYRDNKVILVTVNGALYGAFGDQLGAPKEYPSLVIDKSRTKFLFPPAQKMTEEELKSFLDQFTNGKLAPHLKSEAIPEKETVDGLTTLVGKSFESHLNKGKDMFVLFYAPWCGHCKKLHPDYEKMAKELEKEDVVIAKIDATANDVDPSKYKVQGFPTIFFIPSGGAPVSYNGDRSIDDMKKFIKEHSSKKGGDAKKADAGDNADL